VTEDVLFVFAHQDDEVGVSSRIAYEVRRDSRVWCTYLTDGASNAAASVRDAESLRVLGRLGVERDRIVFLATSDGRLADGTLMENVGAAREALRTWLTQSGVRPARIYTLDWEGGHADHDAAHLVVLAVANDLGIPDVWAFSMYNAYGRPPGLFRVASFVPGDGAVARRALSLGDAARSALLIFAYPSQRRSWLGLGPGWIVKALLRREERIRRAQSARVSARPHEGPLLYESRFKVDARKMMEHSATLRDELLRARRDGGIPR
jgi:LmbE family N-acetylglucosaminyl deacetylase